MSCDSQVAEVALSLSDFNPAAKMAPNPALLSEMRQGAPEEVRVLIRSYMFVCLYLCVCAKQFTLDEKGSGFSLEEALWECNMQTNSIIGDTHKGASPDQ